ncbi:MAG: copper chaperone PCu(A)C [Myxococcota bacterium]
MWSLLSSLALANPANTTVRVVDPYARATVTPSSAGFLVLNNTDTVAHAVVGAASPLVKTVEIHVMETGADGAMTMRPIPRIDLAPGASATLAPGGMHLMLIGVTAPLADGGKLPLTLTFEDGTTSALELPVRKP